MTEDELLKQVKQLAYQRCCRSSEEPFIIGEFVEVDPKVDISLSTPPERAWYVMIQFPKEGDDVTEVRIRQVAVVLREGKLGIEKEWAY